MMSLALFMGLIACAAGGNLLQNPGFEQSEAGKPAAWDVFVQPQPGAFGRLDDRAYTGKHAVMLHVPLPYANEPANNWSQTISGKCAGKTYRVSGYLRTENATEAAIWLQCWRKQPWGVVRAVSSSENSPFYGDKDWQRVEFTIAVPDDTEFLMLRCVLKGVGTAWFDDLEMTEDTAPKPAAAPFAGTSSDVSASSPPRAASPATAGGSLQFDSMEKELARLRDANRALAAAMDTMQATNDRLMEELLVLRESLKNLQDRVREPEQAAPKLSGGEDKKTAEPGERVPPLVPHGENWSTKP